MNVHADKLGTIVMIELRDSIAVPYRDLERQWTLLGLDPKLLPRTRSARDAFRTATPRNKAVNGLQLTAYTGKALKKEGLDMAVCLSRVSDIKTSVRKKHQHRAVVGLDGHGDLVIKLPDHTIGDDETRMIGQIQSTFENMINGQIDGRQIRTAINRAAAQARAIDVKGGVWLFPEPAVATGEALVSLASFLSTYVPASGVPNETMVITYHDTPLQRDQLKAKLDAHIRDTIEGKLVELRTYAQNRKGKVGQAKQDTIMGSIVELQAMTAEYELLLKEQLTDIQTYLSIQKAMFQKELASL